MDIKPVIIRSGRKTLALEINEKGVVVRAPYSATAAEIDRFVAGHKAWIDSHLAKLEDRKKRAAGEKPLTDEEIRELARRALEDIPERVRHYAPLVGVTYGRITIRNQRSRWGSCSKAGNLNFNCLLMLAPPEVRDSVVVHELCHRKEMNHSERFYAEVLRVFPDYRRCEKWLKDNGPVLMARMTGAGE